MEVPQRRERRRRQRWHGTLRPGTDPWHPPVEPRSNPRPPTAGGILARRPRGRHRVRSPRRGPWVPPDGRGWREDNRTRCPAPTHGGRDAPRPRPPGTPPCGEPRWWTPGRAARAHRNTPVPAAPGERTRAVERLPWHGPREGRRAAAIPPFGGPPASNPIPHPRGSGERGISRSPWDRYFPGSPSPRGSGGGPPSPGSLGTRARKPRPTR